MKRIVTTAFLGLFLGCTNWQDRLDLVSHRIDTLSPPLEAHSLDLDVQPDGLVVKGHVASESDKARVLDVARNSVEGEDVIDQLQVVPRMPTVAKEVFVAEKQAILSRVSNTIPKGGYSMMLVTTGDTIHIEGSVANLETKSQIEKLAHQAAPAVKIQNDLKEFTPVPDSLVLAKVKEQLRTEMPEIFSKLDLTCNRGIVTFSGHVAEHQEIDRALATTIMIDGVKDVKSKVTIGG